MDTGQLKTPKGGEVTETQNHFKEDAALPQNGSVASITEGGIISCTKRTGEEEDGVTKRPRQDSNSEQLETELEDEVEVGRQEPEIPMHLHELPDTIRLFLEGASCFHIWALMESAMKSTSCETARRALVLAQEGFTALISPQFSWALRRQERAKTDLAQYDSRVRRAKTRWAAGFADAAADLYLPTEVQLDLTRIMVDEQFEKMLQASPLQKTALEATVQETQDEIDQLSKVEGEWRSICHSLWYQKVSPKNTAALTDPRCRLHKTGDDHMEHYLRHDVAVTAVERLAKQQPSLQVFQAVDPRFLLEVDTLMYAVHVEEYIIPLRDKIMRLGKEPAQLTRNSKDTMGNKDSWEAARVAAAGVLQLCDGVLNGSIDSGFAGVRPPGHHAGREETDGFCLLNNIVLCAKYIKKNMKHWRIATVDFDVHHGDGTQDILAYLKDDDMFFSSIHIATSFKSEMNGRVESFFPGTGEQRSLDSFYNVYNHPVNGPIRKKDFYEYGHAIIARLKWFKPDIILVSAGFDAHKDDPSFRDMIPHKYEGEIEEDDYYYITALLADFARQYCFGRIISSLEGGYNRDVLGNCIFSHVEALLHQGNLNKKKFLKIHSQYYAEFSSEVPITQVH